MNREGFWYSEREPHLPHPAAHQLPFPGQDDFLFALVNLERIAKVTQYRGWSNCRICCCNNGSREFTLHDWQWPEGFRHYVAEHGVRPSLGFYAFVMGRIVSPLPNQMK